MREVGDEANWDALLARLAPRAQGVPPPHVLQSWAWGELKRRWGWTVTRWAWGAPFDEWAAVQMMCRRVGRSPVAVGYASKGPFVLGGDGDRWSEVLTDLQAWGRARRLAVIKIDPDVPSDRTDVAELWRSLGWRPSEDQVQFPNTMRSALPSRTGNAVALPGAMASEVPAAAGTSAAEAIDTALLASYKPKTRYNVRLAQRRGVRVRRGTAADIETLLALYVTTARRQRFGIRAPDYYRDVWSTFLAAGQATLVLAERDGRALAGAVPVRFGRTAWYLYGASSDEDRSDMAPYAVLHDCLCWAAECGCASFDWWGGPSEWSDGDPMAGVGRFKAGFGATWAPQLGAYDLAVSPVAAFAMRTVGRARRTWLRRRSAGGA